MANMKGFYTGDRWRQHVQSQLPKPKEPQCKHPDESHHVLPSVVGAVIQCERCMCGRKVGEPH